MRRSRHSLPTDYADRPERPAFGIDLDADGVNKRLFNGGALVNLYAARQTVPDNRRTLLPRLGAAAEELPGLRARACELRAAAGVRKVTLEGVSDAIASANMQSHIEELAASVGATVSSTEGPPAQVCEGDRRYWPAPCARRHLRDPVEAAGHTRDGGLGTKVRTHAQIRNEGLPVDLLEPGFGLASLEPTAPPVQLIPYAAPARLAQASGFTESQIILH